MPGKEVFVPITHAIRTKIHELLTLHGIDVGQLVLIFWRDADYGNDDGSYRVETNAPYATFIVPESLNRAMRV